MTSTNKIILGDAKTALQSITDNSIDMCVTSPPYFNLRDYGVVGQIGLEDTPEDYINNLVDVFREVRRVLTPSGTLWVNIGDSYNGSGKANGDKNINKYMQGTNVHSSNTKPLHLRNLKSKDLVGIPWMLAFALRADGWYLRQDIIWSKPNPMPESVKDRCTKSHEYIFLLSKSRNYYFNHESIMQPARPSTYARISQDIDNQAGSDRVPGKTNGRMKAVIGGRKRANANTTFDKNNPMFRQNTNREYEYAPMANKRSVLEVATKPFKDAHFATFPQELVIDCIKAGCPEGGIVLDPFMGSGTTAVVSRKTNRNYIGIELNPEYVAIAEKRLYSELGVFQ